MDMSECKRLGTYGPEQALIPGVAFVCTLLPKNVSRSFRKIPMLFHRSPGIRSVPCSNSSAAGFSRGN